MDEEDLHYLAGIVDADGSIYVGVQKRSSAKFGFYIQPNLTVVGLPCPDAGRHELLRRLAVEKESTFGQEIHPSDETQKTSLTGYTAVKVVKELLPYLREKRRVAERLLEEEWGANQYGQNGRPEEVYRSLVEARIDIRKMSSDGGRNKYDREDLLRAVS